MQLREMEHPSLSASQADLIFHTPPNWTYVVFFAGLGLLHLTIATLAFLHAGWEGYLSIGLGSIFVGAAMVCAAMPV